MLGSAGEQRVFHRLALGFQDVVQMTCADKIPAVETARQVLFSERIVAHKKSGRTAFTLVIEAGAAKVRKGFAPAGKPLPDARRKKPRRRPDHLAEADM